MTEKAFAANEVTLEWSDDDTTYETVAGAKNIVIPEVTQEYIDITSLDSNGAREYIKGLTDAGEVSIECLFTPAAFAAAKAKETSGNAIYFKITMPTATGQTGGDEFTWQSFVQTAMQSQPVDGEVLFNLNLKTTGAVTHTPGATS